MKKYLFTILVAAAIGIGTGSAYSLPGNAETLSPSGLENLKALSDGHDGKDGDDEDHGDGEDGSGADLNVQCFCRMDKPAICSAKGTGPYCGKDPCINHDSNCR